MNLLMRVFGLLELAVPFIIIELICYQAIITPNINYFDLKFV